MGRGFAFGVALALGLAGCELPDYQVAVSPMYDQMWAQQRRLCLASPQQDHCDVYLRNETPPAPYATDGILIQQRRLCFESPSVANCALAQRMGREAAAEAARNQPTNLSASARPTEVDDEDDIARAPVPASDPAATIATEPLPAPRPRRRTVTAEGPGSCSPAVLASLDLVEPRVRAGILRRCATVQR